jgi:hypothetical protein
MPKYVPSPTPIDKDLGSYIQRELTKIGQVLADNADSVFYRTLPATDDSFTAGVSANYKIAEANVIRISTSNTVTITGIASKLPNRERIIINVGTGVLVVKPEGTESSASFRFALQTTYQLSQDASIVFWYDLKSARHRCIGRS